MSTNATPRPAPVPWHNGVKDESFRPHEALPILFAADGARVLRVECLPEYDPIAIQDLVLTAVNSHDRLLAENKALREALKAAIKDGAYHAPLCEGTLPSPHGRCDCWKGQARAALAAAREGAP